MPDSVHKKQRHTQRHVSGRVHSVVYWQAKLTNTNNFDTHQSVTGLAGVGTRLTALLGLNSMDNVYEQLSLIVGLRHWQRFVHNLPESATVPYAPTKLRI